MEGGWAIPDAVCLMVRSKFAKKCNPLAPGKTIRIIFIIHYLSFAPLNNSLHERLGGIVNFFIQKKIFPTGNLIFPWGKTLHTIIQ